VTSEPSAVRTVNRICEILNCFSREQPVLSLTAISQRLGLPKSTVHRLLGALLSQGLLARSADGSSYRLGYQLMYWGMLAQASLNLRAEALPILSELCQASGETAILSVRDGNDGICVEMVESSQPVRLEMRVGRRLPLYAGASGKVLLAFLPEPEIRRIVSQIELTPLRPNTITQADALFRELAAIRQRGYATSFEETDSGAMGVAAPVYDGAGKPVAGLGIAAPLARIPREQVDRVVPLVLEASRRLSARLGARQL